MIRTKTSILLLVLIGLCVYVNALINGFIGDDFLQIVNNQHVHSLANILQFFSGSTYETGGADKVAGLFYRPIMLLSFSLLYHFFGLNTAVFHLFQIILNIVNAILLFLFMRSFFKNTFSFLLALVFLVHPINNEAVVYSANLQETLFFLFGMISLLIVKNKKPSLLQAGVASFFVLLSLLSKESGVLFLLLIIIYAFIYKKPFLKPLLLTNILSFVFYLILRYPVAKMHLAHGSITPLYNAPLLDRLLHIPAIIFYYLKTFFFPMQLNSHHFWMIRNISWENFYLPLLALLGLVFLIIFGGIYTFKKHKKKFAHYLFFSTWFSMGLLLHLQIIPLDMTVADRWFYFPIVGLLALMALVLTDVKIKQRFIPGFGVALLIVVIVLLATRTFLRNYDWKDELTLFGRDIQTTPKNFVLDNLYASVLIREGYADKAKPYVESSIKEHPYYANLNNMAIIYAVDGDYKKAKESFKKAVEISKFYVVYENYANFLFIYDSLHEAEAFTRKALGVFPKNSRLWTILAKIQYFTGDKQAAMRSAEKAHTINNSKESLAILQNIKDGNLTDPRKYLILN